MAKFLDLDGLNYFWSKVKAWVLGYSATKSELNGKADKTIPSAAGNIAKLDEHGNLADGGVLSSDVATVTQVNNKADRVLNATKGNIVTFASNGNIADSGKKPSDFATAALGLLAESALQTELDPTVPSWAKQENKPAYDYSEILNTPTIPVVPTNVSAFNNDAGYLTLHQDISGKADKATTLSGYGITDAYTKNDIDAKVSSAYKAAGSVSSVSNLGSLDLSHEGFVYNMSTSFTTTSDFIEGSGITYPAGTNVVIVNSNTVQNPIYKYDVLAGFVDLLNYVQKSNTTGLLKNDGSVDTTQYGTYSKPSGGIPASDLASGVIPSIPVQDVTVDGTSVVSNGTAIIPQDIFIAKSDITSAADIQSAISNGKVVFAEKNLLMYMYCLTDANYIYFGRNNDVGTSFLRCKLSNSAWDSNFNISFQNSSYRVTSISSSSTNAQYPSAKCVYDGLYAKQDKPTITTVSASTLTQEIANNTIYNAGELSALTVTLPVAISADFISEVNFTSGATATTATIPNTVSLCGTNVSNGVFTPVANRRYTLMFYSDGTNVCAVSQGFSTT